MLSLSKKKGKRSFWEGSCTELPLYLLLHMQLFGFSLMFRATRFRWFSLKIFKASQTWLYVFIQVLVKIIRVLLQKKGWFRLSQMKNRLWVDGFSLWSAGAKKLIAAIVGETRWQTKRSEFNTSTLIAPSGFQRLANGWKLSRAATVPRDVGRHLSERDCNHLLIGSNDTHVWSSSAGRRFASRSSHLFDWCRKLISGSALAARFVYPVARKTASPQQTRLCSLAVRLLFLIQLPKCSCAVSRSRERASDPKIIKLLNRSLS